MRQLRKSSWSTLGFPWFAVSVHLGPTIREVTSTLATPMCFIPKSNVNAPFPATHLGIASVKHELVKVHVELIGEFL